MLVPRLMGGWGWRTGVALALLVQLARADFHDWTIAEIYSNASGSVQFIEVTPEKKIVWALRSWDEPANFGPATTLQLLDEPGVPENGELLR